MYNRYVPQADGSFQKNRVPDRPAETAPPLNSPAPPVNSSTPPPKPPEGIFSFFRNLLPKSMDTGDLIVILLLLLIANDSEGDRAHFLLTLALYFLL